MLMNQQVNKFSFNISQHPRKSGLGFYMLFVNDLPEAAGK
jgi:hypothetical protein